MEKIEGNGFWSGLASGVCGAWAAAGLVAQATVWSNPITGTAAAILTGGCLVYGAGSLYNQMVE